MRRLRKGKGYKREKKQTNKQKKTEKKERKDIKRGFANKGRKKIITPVRVDVTMKVDEGKYPPRVQKTTIFSVISELME